MTLSGTKEFLDNLTKTEFLSGSDQVKELRGKEVTEDYFIKNGFNKPIIVRKKKGLRLQVPDRPFTIKDIEIYLGHDYILDVIDVLKMDQFKMNFSDFLHYFEETEPRSRRLNVLSLEISKTRMSHLVEPPYVIKEMSLIEKLWPCDDIYRVSDKPSVQKYCLMSMRDSYTDYHIDFGGSSVWYHVLWGHKVFYLIPPKKRYIKAYTRWISQYNNRLLYFPDQLKQFSDNGIPEVYKLEIKSGDTIMLPAGWIHAVHTLEDSLVFGGNFLHSLSIPLQLKIYKIERLLQTEEKFLFPFFEKLHWFVAEYILHKLERNIAHNVPPVKQILKGALKLIEALPEWLCNYSQLGHDERQYFYPHKSYLSSTKVELIGKLSSVVHGIINSVPMADRGSQEPTPSRCESSSLTRYCTNATEPGSSQKRKSLGPLPWEQCDSEKRHKL